MNTRLPSDKTFSDAIIARAENGVRAALARYADNSLGRAPIPGRFGIPDDVAKAYIAAAERVAAEVHGPCGHVNGDHQPRWSYFPYDLAPGLLCSLCRCGWDEIESSYENKWTRAHRARLAERRASTGGADPK